MTLVKELNLPIPSTFQIHEPSVLEPPFIIKNSESRKGREVYFIKDKPALNKVYDFLSSKEAYVPSLGGLVTYDASIENKKFIKQEYIKTPSNHFTTYRITVSCVGEIFSSCITYSGTTKNSPQLLQSTYLDNWTNKDLLTLTDSPFYIGSQKIVSNKSAGGGWIVINRTTNSKLPSNTEKRILREHGLDEESPKTPALLKNLSINIAKYLGSKGKGMIFGIDWIQSTDNRLYYIETNVSPAAMPYMYSHQNGEGTHQDGMTTMLRETIKNIAQQ